MADPKYDAKYDALYDQKVDLFVREYEKKETQVVIKALTRDVRDKLEELLKENRIKAVVTTRPKDPKSLRKKLMEAREDFISWLRQPEHPNISREKRLAAQEAANSSPSNPAPSSGRIDDHGQPPESCLLDELRWNLYEHEDVGDFAGARIGLYLPGETVKTGLLIKKSLETFHVFGTVLDTTRSVRSARNKHIEEHGRKRWTRVLGDIKDDWEHYGYKSWQVVVKWKPEWYDALPGIAELPAIFQPLRVEIQIGTVITQAWAEVQHDIIYKQPEHIQVTPTMLRMVDATNGMAITTDILLDELEISREKAKKEVEKSEQAAKARLKWEKDNPIGALLQYSRYGDAATRARFLSNIDDMNAQHYWDGERYTLLHAAASNNLSGMVTELLDAKADANVRNKYGNTALHLACQLGRTNVVEKLLGKADINIRNDGGNTALMQAVIREDHDVVRAFAARCDLSELVDGGGALILASVSGNSKIVKELLAAGVHREETRHDLKAWHWASFKGHTAVVAAFRVFGVDMNGETTVGRSALQFAAAEGHVGVVRELIAAGVDLEAANKDSYTALHLAAINGHVGVVSKLITARVHLEAADKDGWTALHKATADGHVGVVSELIAAGVNLEAPIQNGWTALRIAISHGYVGVVRELIAGGVDLEAADEDGRTALHIAAWKGHVSVVSELIAAGVNLEVADENGWTALRLAASRGYIDVMRELIAADVDLEAANKDGWTVLHMAAANGHVSVVSELITARVNLEAAGKDGQTALHRAAFRGYTDIVRELLLTKVNLEATDGIGRTAFHIAASGGHVDIVKDLLASINREARDEFGMTALHCAIEEGHVDVARVLILAKVNLRAETNRGVDALGLANSTGNQELVALLVEALESSLAGGFQGD